MYESAYTHKSVHVHRKAQGGRAMKKYRIRGTLLLAAMGLLLAGGVSAGKALAYFTAYASAGGELQLRLDFPATETNDDVRDWTKHISITNTGEEDCYVRVRVFAGEKYLDSLEYTAASEAWSYASEEGCWYYGDILTPGETTAELLVKLDRIKLQDMTGNGGKEDFNVIVVQEYTAVLHDAQGNPYADWNLAVSGGETRNADGSAAGF